MHVLIATPTAGQLVTSGYTATLVNATRALHAAGMDYRHSTFDGADIVLARNYFANEFLRNPEATHILWLDSDMAIGSDVFRRMLQFNKPFVGGVYTERALDLEKYVELRGQGLPDDQARGLSTNFNVRVKPGELKIENGFCPVLGMGFGCVLTRRDLLQKMVDTKKVRQVPSGKLARLGIGDTMYDFFSEIRREDGSYFSEDYSFCQRVSAVGETVWALVDIQLGHIGKFEYGASFLSRLQGQVTLKEKK